MMMTEERMAGYFRLRANTQTRELSGLDPTYQGAKLNFTDGKYAVIKVPGRTEWDGFGPLYLYACIIERALRMSEILSQATRLTASGLSVIPIKPDGTKTPNIPTWKLFQGKIADPLPLKSWFQSGANGLAVIGGGSQWKS